MNEPVLVAVAVAINAAAGFLAYRRGSVSGSGGFAGALVGSAIMIGGGLPYWVMLMLFFVSSSAAGKIGGARRPSLDRMHERGSRRDWVQVAANGGIAAVAVVLLGLTGRALFGFAAAGALAGATADTWASELGVLSRRRPRSVITFRQLEPGTSGGVSWTGTIAAAGGSMLIAFWFATVGRPVEVFPAFAAVWFAGLAGTTVDSVLGATVQAQYRDGEGRLTERPTGGSGPNRLVRGLAFVRNDAVNLAASVSAAIVAVALAAGLSAIPAP